MRLHERRQTQNGYVPHNFMCILEKKQNYWDKSVVARPGCEMED